MICPYCNNTISENIRFCPICGKNIQCNSNQNPGRLSIKRENKFFGYAVFCTIYINNKLIGVLGNGEQMQLNLPFGTHNIKICTPLSPSKKQTITITPQQPNITLFVTPSFCGAKIYNIQYI